MNEDKNESLISHIEALRKTILKCICSIAIVMPVAFYFTPKILNKVIDIIMGDANVSLNYFSPVEIFMIQIKTALVVDIIICFPYIAKNIWDFVLPALYEHEKKFIKNTVLISSFLFIAGVAFCIFFILPLIIKFGMSFATDNIQAVFGISNIVNIALWLSIVFGLTFQVPLITIALIKSGFVSYESVAGKRPYVIIALLIFAGILTPPDIISQLMLAIPSYMLFEMGLLYTKCSMKKNGNDE